MGYSLVMFDTNPTESEINELMTVLTDSGDYSAEELNCLGVVFRYTDWEKFGKPGQMAHVPLNLMVKYNQGMVLFAGLIRKMKAV